MLGKMAQAEENTEGETSAAGLGLLAACGKMLWLFFTQTK